jgi:tRNA threonylcarbamoyladenosine biosynthesis protein TsaE
MSPVGTWTLRTTTASQTAELAGRLASLARPGDLVLVSGELGTGKTVFAQGFAGGLGIQGPVTSPTFTLLRQYECPGPGPLRQLLHADLYRLEDLGEVIDLALPELLDDGAVAVVEWGERGAPVLGDSALEVCLAASASAIAAGVSDDGGEPGVGDRVVTVTARGPNWAGREAEVAAVLDPWTCSEPT